MGNAKRQMSFAVSSFRNTRNSSTLPKNCPRLINPALQEVVPIGDAPMMANGPTDRPVDVLAVATSIELIYNRIPLVVLNVWAICVHVFSCRADEDVAETTLFEESITLTVTRPVEVKPHISRQVL